MCALRAPDRGLHYASAQAPEALLVVAGTRSTHGGAANGPFAPALMGVHALVLGQSVSESAGG